MPCLYIHGGPGSGSYWMEKFAGDILEKRFRMVYIDLRGVGRSGSPVNGEYGMERMVKDFEEVRAHLGVERWMVMGHSFSGTLLTGYALRQPQAIEGMMMFNCTLDLQESISQSWVPRAVALLEVENPAYYVSDSVSLHEKLNRLFGQLNQKDLGWKLAFDSKEQETRMNATFHEIPDWNGAFSGIGLSHPDYLRNFKPLTSEINIPVLYFYGARDWTIGPDHYKGIQFPKLLLYPAEVGHVPFMDQKTEVARAIDLFKETFRL